MVKGTYLLPFCGIAQYRPSFRLKDLWCINISWSQLCIYRAAWYSTIRLYPWVPKKNDIAAHI